MKSYTQVYNTSRAEVQAHRQRVFETQKVAVVNVLKEIYNISGKMSDLDAETKAKMAEKLKEYWSPKTGLTNAGVSLLNENQLILTPKSTTEDVRIYIRKQTTKNIVPITECFRHNQIDIIVENFNKDIKEMTGKTVKDKFIIDTCWSMVADRIKSGI